MKKKLFDYVILYHQELKSGNVDTFFISRGHVLATSDKQATLLAGRQIPEEYLQNIDQMEVIVRPF